MAGFSFPPPPPPPPRPQPSAPNDSSQRGFNNIWGDRGGRGNSVGRGRGQSNSNRGGGQQRGGHDFQQPRNQRMGGDRRQGHAGRDRVQYQQYGNGHPTQQQQHTRNQYLPVSSSAYGQTQVPVNSYVNPAFSSLVTGSQTQATTPVQPQIDTMAFMQAFSTFMVSQAGMQNMTTPVNAVVPNQYQPPPQAFRNHQSPPTTNGKRKRDPNEDYQERHVPQFQNNSPQKPKPAKLKASVPPTVPSFGSALPTVPKPSPAPSPALTKGKKDKTAKKRNLLGLTPQIDHSDSDRETIDEEAAYGNDLAGLTFEYNGQVAALNSPAEIAAWIRERRKLYPTKARAKQKIQEDRVKLANEQAILQRVKEEAETESGVTIKADQKKDTKSHKKSQAAAEYKQRKMEHERQVKSIEKLRKKLQKSEEMLARSEGTLEIGQSNVKANADTAPDTESLVVSSGEGLSKNGLGLNYDTDSAGQATDSKNESSKFTDSDASSDLDSDLDLSSECDSDSAPEEETTKSQQPLRLPPPKERKTRRTEKTVCSYFKKTGKCTYQACKFSHSPEVAATQPKKRMTLYDKLVEQEEKEADLLALQAIKYLGSSGFLS